MFPIPLFTFNKTPVVVCSYQKYLGVFLDKKLNFQHHIKKKITKASKGIGVIKKLKNVLPRNALLTIFKLFLRPHLDYGIFYIINLIMKVWKYESVQHSAALAITGAIKESSRSKFYKELGLESLKSRRTFRCFCTFHKLYLLAFQLIFSA